MIAGIAGLVSFVVGIMVLIKLFQKEGVMKGILGLICMLYTYIWGWQHAKEQNITNLMWVWTVVIIISAVVGAVAGGSGAGGGGTEQPTGLLLKLLF
jgi:uncharacterized membrane protein YfcA